MPEIGCEQLGIPARLWSKEEKPLKGFEPEELLYRRVRANVDFESNGTLTKASFASSFSPPCNISCNRSALCEHPTDVLYSIKEEVPHHFTGGVIKASVSNIKGLPFSFIFLEKEFFGRFDVAHKPEKCMYAHTEILVYSEDVLVTPNEKKEVKPGALKIAIRDALSELFTVSHNPDSNFHPPEN